MDEKLKATEALLESKVVLVVTVIVALLKLFHFSITIISRSLDAVLCLTEP